MKPNTALGIPKKLGHIWIGPKPAPHAWMSTWRDKHPDWEYTIYDNKFLESYNFKTRTQIDEYLKRGRYAGVADLMRLEILHDFGGLLAASDSICLKNTEELFTKACAYTVYENEQVRGKLVSPIQAAPPKNEFIGALIEILCNLPPEELREPWISTGNLFTAQMIEALKPDIEIFPSHYLIPIHYTGICHEGEGPIYAIQQFATTKNRYGKGSIVDRLVNLPRKRAMNSYNQTQQSRARGKKLEDFFSKFNIPSL